MRRPFPFASRRTVARGQSGAFLLEALVGVLIFAFGILGLVGLQAVALRNTNDLQYRGEAIQIANADIGRMWTMNRADLEGDVRGRRRHRRRRLHGAGRAGRSACPASPATMRWRRRW